MKRTKRVLLIGSGGREHAIAWKLAESPIIEKLFIAPGNPGTALVGENIAIKVSDFEGICAFAKKEAIDLVVVGPDDPLAAGIVDRLQEIGIPAFGPSKDAAEIEASKAFAKAFMKRHHIPTAEFETFTEFEPALAYVRNQGVPIVVKASGLALGKGVTVCMKIEEAEQALKEIMVDKIFGAAGSEVVIEEFLEGPEVSIHVFSDGTNFKLFPTGQDHKPAFDNDEGPNTGGMGTITPLPWVTNAQLEEITTTIVTPALAGLKAEGRPFVGVLYPGLKMTAKGPKVLEFNARFGDPETQSYMRLLETDLLEIFVSCVEGTLDRQQIQWSSQSAATIVLASGGYPKEYKKGLPISGLDEASRATDVVIFQAGTALDESQLVTHGGRVLGVSAMGSDLSDALKKAYAAVRMIHFDGMQYRTDIGAKSINQ